MNTLVMFVLLISLAYTMALNYENILEDYPLASSKNISDALLVVDPATFINDFGVRRTRGEKQPRRYDRIRALYPEEKTLHLKVLDLMKQVIYSTQDGIKTLNPVLEKYQDDMGFRMKFIFNRLKQYVIDIRRIYTLAVTRGEKIRVDDHIRLYQHCAKKHIDVIYVVDHLIELHGKYIKIILQH